MEDIFKSFCMFGQKDAAALMDGSKFAKLCRDCKILDKKVTTTDVDIIFSKVKAKTERKINYKQFREALKMLAEKKFPGDEEGLSKLEKIITDAKGPVASGVTKTVKSGAVGRLTDTSKYTGSHKERFDKDGKGKGIEGRRDVNKNAAAGYVTGFKAKDSDTQEKSG